MNAFTVIGVLVFWWWCFELGCLLGFMADVVPLLLRGWLLERRIAKDIAAFTQQLATRHGSTA